MIDCYSSETALLSLAKQFSVSAKELYSLLAEASNAKIIDYDPMLRFKAESLGLSCETAKFCWYHASRVLNPKCFKDGIKPLGKIQDSLWEYLFQIFGSEIDKKWLIDLFQSYYGKRIHKLSYIRILSS